jgi:hypothetical protein
MAASRTRIRCPLPPALVAPPTADVTQIRAQATEDYAPQYAGYELARRVVIAFQQVAISVRVFATERARRRVENRG